MKSLQFLIAATLAGASGYVLAKVLTKQRYL
jgi:hypothetical protein